MAGTQTASERVAPQEDTGEFTAWMAEEQRRVFLLCWRMLGSRDEADTAAQDVFLKAWKAMRKGSVEAIEEPAKWLTRVTVNTCLDRLRNRRWQFWRRRAEPAAEDLFLAQARAAVPGPEQAVFAEQVGRRMALAVETLSARQRAVFLLRHHEDRSLEEIGEILEIDTGTVKAHLARALSKLRVELRDLYVTHPLER